MGRSLKKGPFVNAKLLKAIEEMNAANEKKLSRHGQDHPQYSRRWWDTRLQCTTVRNMFLYTSQKTW